MVRFDACSTTCLRQISTKKRYADLVALCDLARLIYVETDYVVRRDGPVRPARGVVGAVLLERAGAPDKIKSARHWGWPDPVDEAERVATLQDFTERLRHRFPPTDHHKVLATITLISGTFDFDTVERAFTAAGWSSIVLRSLAKLNRETARPDFRGGALPLIWNVFELHEIERLNNVAGVEGDEWSVMGSYSGKRRINVVRGREDNEDCWMLTPAADFFHDRFLPTLYGVNLARIRICPICPRPFIALRKDRSACSAACLNAHRQRELRRRWKERGKIYEQHRKRNRLTTAAVRRRLIKQ